MNTIETTQVSNDWVKIDYSLIPKEIFDKYGAKPFEIMKRKMRNAKGEVWNNVSWNDAKEEAKKLGYRLPSIQEILVLLHAYKEQHPDDADIYCKQFLGIEELSYGEDVCYEWIDAPSPCVRGSDWTNGSDGRPFTVNLRWVTGSTSSNVGFRCAR